MSAGLLDLALPFALVLTRLGALLVTLPFAGGEIAPVRLRAAVAVAISLVLTASLPSFAAPESLLIAFLGEAWVGAAAGLVVRISLAAAEMAGEVAGMQMGFGFARSVDPAMRESAGALARLATLISGLLLFTTDAHHEILRGLAAGMRAMPPGAVTFSRDVSALLLDRAGDLFVAALRIAAPLVAAVLASHLCFGLVSKVAPQMNLWAIGFVTSIAVGLISLAIFAPTLVADLRSVLTDGVADAVVLLAR